MARFREWWRIWWDETLIIVGSCLAMCLVGYGLWFFFQTHALSLSEGKVVNQSYTAQYEETHDGGTTCWNYDKNGSCTFRTQNPDIHHTHCIGGCYRLRVDGCSNDRRGESHCREEWENVSASTYESCEPGSYWVKEKVRCAPR